jgi:hypothetical protein
MADNRTNRLFQADSEPGESDLVGFEAMLVTTEDYY